MKKNTGKTSEKIFEDNVEGLVFRFRDKSDLMGLNKNARITTFGNPSDYVLCNESGMFLAEVKSSNSKSSFSFSNFTKAQLAAIYKMYKKGYGERYRIYVHSLASNVWYLITAKEIMEQKGKSIKWKNMSTLTSWSI